MCAEFRETGEKRHASLHHEKHHKNVVRRDARRIFNHDRRLARNEQSGRKSQEELDEFWPSRDIRSLATWIAWLYFIVHASSAFVSTVSTSFNGVRHGLTGLLCERHGVDLSGTSRAFGVDMMGARFR